MAASTTFALKAGAAFWMNIQSRFDLKIAEDELASTIESCRVYNAA